MKITNRSKQMILAIILASSIFSQNGYTSLIKDGSVSSELTNWSTLPSVWPMITVDVREVDFSSVEVSERLLVEAHGDADPVLLSILATKLGLTIEETRKRVLDEASSTVGNSK